MTTEQIAQVAHEANRAYCHTQGDESQLPWEAAPDWQKASAINGVQHILDGAVDSPEESHRSWCAQKQDEGWVYGPVKDSDAKTHPCMVPYDQLPPDQQVKDHLFFAVVRALAPRP